jgi:hypothetical protein
MIKKYLKIKISAYEINLINHIIQAHSIFKYNILLSFKVYLFFLFLFEKKEI